MNKELINAHDKFFVFFKTEIKKRKRKKERKKKPQYIYFCIIVFSYGMFSKHFPLLSWALSPCKYFIGPAAGLLQNAINLGDHVVTYRIFNNDYKTLLLFCFLVIAVSKFHFFALFFHVCFLGILAPASVRSIDIQFLCGLYFLNPEIKHCCIDDDASNSQVSVMEPGHLSSKLR